MGAVIGSLMLMTMLLLIMPIAEIPPIKRWLNRKLENLPMMRNS